MLLDENGDLIGVVSSKLNFLSEIKNAGDIPQNVNFAIKASVVANFLQDNAIKFQIGEATQPMKGPDLADRRKLSARLSCVVDVAPLVCGPCRARSPSALRRGQRPRPTAEKKGGDEGCGSCGWPRQADWRISASARFPHPAGLPRHLLPFGRRDSAGRDIAEFKGAFADRLTPPRWRGACGRANMNYAPQRSHRAIEGSRAAICARGGQALYLFGSHARDEAGAISISTSS